MTAWTPTEAQRAAIREGRRRRRDRALARGRGKLLSYRAQAFAMIVFVALLRLLPVEAGSNLGGWIGRRYVARRIDTEAIRRTIRVVFPKADDAEVGSLVVQTADNIVRVVAEMARLDAFTGADNPRLRVEGAEHLAEARRGGRGVLFVMGHFANWEIAAIPLRNLGLDGVFAVMPPSNPYVFAWLSRLRISVGLSEQANAGEGVYKAFRRNLRQGRAAILLADQRLGNGIAAPFFGVETTTNVIPARLARTLNVAVVPLAVRRVAGRAAHFSVTFLPPLEFEATGDAPADERQFTARINAFFEAEILNAPGQWLWVDPRWDAA